MIISLFVFSYFTFSYLFLPIISTNENLLYRYLGDNSTNADSERSLAWDEGMQYLTDNKHVILLGNGLGSVAVKGGLKGEFQGKAYESTFLAKMIDMGLCGILILLFPAFYIIWQIYKLKHKIFFDILSFTVIINYLFISLISPNGASVSTQYIMYLLVGIYIVRPYYCFENE